jgi:drug/metabolite transporter superfamily protein YnfA
MKHAIRMVLWLIAAGLIVIGGLNVTLELTRHWLRQTSLSVWFCLLWAVFIVLGVILFLKASALAGRVTDDFEE